MLQRDITVQFKQADLKAAAHKLKIFRCVRTMFLKSTTSTLQHCSMRYLKITVKN